MKTKLYRAILFAAIFGMAVGCRHSATLDGHKLTATSQMTATCEELADGTKKWTIDTTKTSMWDNLKAGGKRVLDAFAGIVGRAGVAVD